MSEQTAPAFTSTKQQDDELLKVIEKYKGTKGALIPVLHEAQEIFGYLPVEVQNLSTKKGRKTMTLKAI